MLKLRLVALGTIAAIVGLVYTLSSLKHHPRQPTVPSASAAPSTPVATPSAEAAPEAALPSLAAPVSSNGIRDYAVLPDGKPVPELPASAPKTCGFGAILFTYEGVQLAPRHARSKHEALELARATIADAERDFADAVKKGDPGSLADAGSIGRGILERAVEYQLFTLEKGKVYPEPIETPRGYWILKRTR